MYDKGDGSKLEDLPGSLTSSDHSSEMRTVNAMGYVSSDKVLDTLKINLVVFFSSNATDDTEQTNDS